MNKKKLLKALALITWAFIIFIFSNRPNSGEETKTILETSLPFISNINIISVLNFIIRKLAHLTEYFILTLLAVSLLKEYTTSERKIIIISLVFCFLYACTDEYHQSLIPGRTSAFRDVLIDTSGGLIYILIYYLKNKKSQKKILN